MERRQWTRSLKKLSPIRKPYRHVCNNCLKFKPTSSLSSRWRRMVELQLLPSGINSCYANPPSTMGRKMCCFNEKLLFCWTFTLKHIYLVNWRKSYLTNFQIVRKISSSYVWILVISHMTFKSLPVVRIRKHVQFLKLKCNDMFKCVCPWNVACNQNMLSIRKLPTFAFVNMLLPTYPQAMQS